MTTILESTRSFEKWLRKQISIVESDLDYKHHQMATDRFLFLRATFYRWIELWPHICPDLANGPEVSAVGDLHIENFGTWRDIEGRLVWGVNDFDEATPLSYANDLVRVATSATMAGDGVGLRLDDVCLALMDGYQRSLEEQGEPLVLGRKHHTLRKLALEALADPVDFWNKLESKTAVTRSVPKPARAAIAQTLPEGASTPEYRVVIKPKGLGSLGRQRFIAFSSFHGEIIAREAKAMVPSAINWSAGKKISSKRVIKETIEEAVRCPDPFWTLEGKWQARRLSPDCRRIDLEDLSKADDIAYVIRAMGKEIANIHLGRPESLQHIKRDLQSRSKSWLRQAVENMSEAITRDWEDWKENF